MQFGSAPAVGVLSFCSYTARFPVLAPRLQTGSLKKRSLSNFDHKTEIWRRDLNSVVPLWRHWPFSFNRRTSTMSAIGHFGWTAIPTKSRVQERSSALLDRELPQKR